MITIKEYKRRCHDFESGAVKDEIVKVLRDRERLQTERDDLARALFQIRSLTMRGRGQQRISQIACDAVLHIDEAPLFPARSASSRQGGNTDAT